MALVVSGVLVLVAALPAFASGLSLNLGPASSAVACDVFDGCSGTVSGNLAGQTGSYTLELALELSDITDTEACFAPAPGATNQATITFTNPASSGQLVMNLGQVCLPTDLQVHSGTVAIPFSVQSGTLDYAGATGTGTIDRTFEGSILAPPILTLATVNSANFNVPTASGDPGTGIPNPAATPELSSLTLFGSALLSFGGYIGVRRLTRRAPE